MTASPGTVRVLFRAPRLPVIVISKERLLAAADRKTLAAALHDAAHHETAKVRALDASGDEFWYLPEQGVLAPGFFPKKWTKKNVVELFNSSINSKELRITCRTTGLSNKTLSEIIISITTTILRHNIGLSRRAPSRGKLNSARGSAQRYTRAKPQPCYEA